jgi:hypothetical protein
MAETCVGGFMTPALLIRISMGRPSASNNAPSLVTDSRLAKSSGRVVTDVFGAWARTRDLVA